MRDGSRAILISGATGLVGRALASRLAREGRAVLPLVRQEGAPGVHWDPVAGRVDTEKLEGAAAIVHLAGESIAGRWTEGRLARIRDSRVQGTRLLAGALAGLEAPPDVLVCASAVGYYGDRGDEELDEDSPPGTGLLPDICREWEDACDPARQAGIRVVNLRIGLVLARQGGALAKMLTPFRLGLGGKIGPGLQQMSWISLPDLVSAILVAVDHGDLRGPVNAVSPAPVTNLEFTKTLGRVLRRPTLLPLPAFAVRLLFGRMGEDLLLAGQRVLPGRLAELGFAFQHPDLETALRAVLTPPGSGVQPAGVAPPSSGR